jgi:hypothetical protein
MSDEDKRHLLWGEESLLDVAAAGSQRAVMLLLIENGVTKWFGSQENNRAFIRLIEDYLVDVMFGNFLQSANCCNKSSLKTDEEPTTKTHIRRMDVLKYKNNLADATKAIQFLLAYQKQWLISRLRSKAWVRNTSEIVGNNISWFIKDGVLGAYDDVTGRKFRMDQVLFEKPVQLLICGELDEENKEWTVKIEGTTEQVLEKIYSAYKYKSMFEEMGDGWFFEGLHKVHKGKYFLHLGSWYCSTSRQGRSISTGNERFFMGVLSAYKKQGVGMEVRMECGNGLDGIAQESEETIL